MAKTLSNSGISTTQTIEAGHVTQSVDALTGTEAYDITISGSLSVTGPTTLTGTTSGSFQGDGSGLTGVVSSSFASTATSASYALTASFLEGSVTSASYAETSSFAQSGNGSFSGSFSGSFDGSITSASYAATATSASYALTASFLEGSVTSASYALTASYVETAQTSSYVNPLNQDVIITGSVDVLNGNVNLDSNSNFFQGTSVGGGNVSLIGVNLSDQIYIGDQGFDNIIADDLSVDGNTTITGSLTVSGSTSAVNLQEIQFDTAHSASGHSTGRMYWSDDNKTVNLEMQGSDVVLQLGQEEHVYAKNISGVTISNGDAVRVSGATGGNVTIEKAVSSIKSFKDTTEQDQILGLATEEIPDNQSGYITTFGAVRGLDTSAFSAGDILYLSDTTSGSYTNTKPSAPNFPARIGIVQVTDATNGVILTKPSEPIFLTDIAQVTASGVITNEKTYLCYDDSTDLIEFTNEFSGSFSGSFEGNGSGLTDLAAGSNGEIQFNNNGELFSNSAFTYKEGLGDFLVGDGFDNNTISASMISRRLTIGDADSAMDGYKIDILNFITVGSKTPGIYLEGPTSFDSTITASNDISASGDVYGVTGSFSHFTNVNSSNTMTFEGPITSNVNGTTVVEVSGSSQIPNTLASNTTYIIRGSVETGRTINVTNPGTAVVGVDKNAATLCYTGSAELFNVVDENFSVRNITIKTSGSFMEASNIEVGGPYNNNRRKVLDLENVVVRNSNNLMSVKGFELVDLNNCFFWYVTGSQGLQFQSCRHLEISSCELYNWYNETDTGSFAPSGTKMIEILPNTGSVNTPVVNINSCIVHPEQGQIGLYIDSGSRTLFGTVAANTFIDVNGGVLLGGSTYDSSSMLKYDVGLNQGLEDSQAYLYGYQNGTDVQSASATYTQITIADFQTNISSRMSASLEGVVYVGTKPIDVAVTVNVGLDGIGSNSEEFDIAIFKNSSLISGSERQISLDTNEVGNVQCFALANIVENDLLTVYQKSPTSDDFTLDNFSIMIKQ